MKLKLIISALLVVGIFFAWEKFDNKPQTNNPEIKEETIIQNQTTTENKKMGHLITLHTNLGDIQFETFDQDAPKTVKNFMDLAQKDFYNNVIFHRIIKGFMIQGGDPTGTGTGGPGYKFEDELNSETESYKNGYKKGVVAMANAGPNTNGSQFFIMLEDTPLPHAYSIFGKVVNGQDIVDKIGSVETNEANRPLEDVRITKVSLEIK